MPARFFDAKSMYKMVIFGKIFLFFNNFNNFVTFALGGMGQAGDKTKTFFSL